MTITAKIIKDSITVDGVRVTTWVLKYPRFIHSELMTHRVFSRNASSSRATPFKKNIADIRKDMAMPIHWGANQSGMQAKTELTGWRKVAAVAAWRGAGYISTWLAQLLNATGVHKQIVNRCIEPWSHITVILTGTDFENFFELRTHPYAQPEFQFLARMMKDMYCKNTPELLNYGEWHLPFVDDMDVNSAKHYLMQGDPMTKEYTSRSPEVVDILKKLSAARCARVSYLTHDGRRPDITEDIKLFHRLTDARPMHASPVEHQTTPDSLRKGEVGPYGEWVRERWNNPHLSGNFRPGVIQWRKILEQDL